MPLPDWESLPPSYYSFAGMATYCRLFARRLPDEMLDWFAANRSVVVPLHLRKRKLEAWFREQMSVLKPVPQEQGRGYTLPDYENSIPLNRGCAGGVVSVG